MTRIIKNGSIVDDVWTILKLAEGETPDSVALPEQNVIVPLPVWQARKNELIGRGHPFGVWLDSQVPRRWARRA
mgnify:CR=1 FL=1